MVPRGLRAGALLAASALLAVACGTARPVPDREVTPPDDGGRTVRLAEARLEAGAYGEAARLFDTVVQRVPASAFRDRALLGLGRVLVSAEPAGRDYRQAHAVFDRLAREHPGSPYAPEARAWRDLLGLYLSQGQELERRTRELERRTQELRERTEDLERLKRVDLELERRRTP